MITIDGKTYRTLPEQVEENAKNVAIVENSIDELEESINDEIETNVAYLSDMINGVQDDFSQSLSEVSARIDVVEEELDNAITAEQVRDIVDEELGVIVNGRY